MWLSVVFTWAVCLSYGKKLRESDISTIGRYDYVVSIPDVHGDLEGLLRTLWIVKIEIDGSDSGGTFDAFKGIFNGKLQNGVEQVLSPILPTVKRVLMIQTGDIVDRGAASLSCYKAIWLAESILGWDLINLIGNHEVMSMAGEADSYAHPSDVAEFGSLKARRAAFANGGPLWKKITDTFLFMVRVRMGESDSTLFLHAGLDARWMSRFSKDFSNLSEVNEKLLSELRKNPSSQVLVSSGSPIWTRDLAQGSEKSVCERQLPKVLEMAKVKRMVVGHTPQRSLTTASRCDATLILADVAMSRWMGSGKFGNPSALIFQLGDGGNRLDRIYNVYWKAANGQTVDQLIYQSDVLPQEL